MNDIILKAVIAPLMVAAITGLTILAFSEPEIYAVLYWVANVPIGLFIVWAALWNVALIWTQIKVSEAIEEYTEQSGPAARPAQPYVLLNSIRGKIEKATIGYPLFTAAIVLSLYLSGLLMIPHLRAEYEHAQGGNHKDIQTETN